jgi:hypothetical protein
MLLVGRMSTLLFGGVDMNLQRSTQKSIGDLVAELARRLGRVHLWPD